MSKKKKCDNTPIIHNKAEFWKDKDDGGTILDGECFCIDKLNHDYYTFYFPNHRSHIFLDEREVRDIIETFTKYVTTMELEKVSV